MRTRRVKRIDRLEDLGNELFEIMYDELHPEHDEFWRESKQENCVQHTTGCPEPECKCPSLCGRFQFRPGHKFARFNEVLHT